MLDNKSRRACNAFCNLRSTVGVTASRHPFLDMPRNSSAIKEAFRYLAILQRIPANSWVSSTDIENNLALAGLNVPKQTLQRSLKKLSNTQEFGVECNKKGKPYSYRCSNTSGLLQVDLSPEECLLYRLVEENLLHQLPKNLLLSLQPLFAKARESLKETKGSNRKRAAGAWLDKVAVVPDVQQLMPPAIKPRIFNEVSSALFEEKWLEVSYTNREGQKKEKKLVNPLAIVQQGPCVYLVVLFETHVDVRHLALHRLTEVRKTDRPAPRPAGFSLKTYLDEVKFNYTGATVDWVSLVFETHDSVLALRLKETPLAPRQTIKKTGDDVWIVHVPRIKASPLLDQWLRAHNAENVQTTVIETRTPQRVDR